MSTPHVFQKTSPWTNQTLRLYHGTIHSYAASITGSGVRIAMGNTGTDFGPGFYTTTLDRQARSWAWQLATRAGGAPTVIYADVSRDAIAALDSLVFVRGDFDADDYWSLVTHCRRGGTDHARSGPQRSFDVVAGPVAATWTQRGMLAGADQISFHTSAAEALLNSVSWRVLR
ncbi:MAG TPA: DUF3990 domain-containing protein [Longimicrobium sp.]|nr:DUF3990 domain-containing protein [Longimicrobium sp.]